jgi:hypothetical protein
MASAVPAAAQEAARPAPGPLTIETQGSFFVGGRDVRSDTLSTLPAYAPSGTITVDQVYVRYQVPADAGRRYPITAGPRLLPHGQDLGNHARRPHGLGRVLRPQGPPDLRGRPGVARPLRGEPGGDQRVKTGKAPAEELPTVFAAGHEPAWAIFRFGPEHPRVFPGMLFPLEAQGEFWKQMVPDWLASLPTPNPTVPALSELAVRLGGTVLVSHSQSGIYPFQTAALSRQGSPASSPSSPAPARLRTAT